MNNSCLVSPFVVELAQRDCRQMIRLVRCLFTLSQNNAYQSLLQTYLAVTAQHQPKHNAVMMGYDFHLSPQGPKLIEVNTNAGGLWFACLAHNATVNSFPKALAQQLSNSFFNEYALFCQDSTAKPRCLVILDDAPKQQFLYDEMLQFADLFSNAGIKTFIAAPEDLQLSDKGLFIEGQRVDLIYNRHCDFYLETQVMQAVRHAWLNGQVCLSPNPRAYGLLADKQRMILWSNTAELARLGVSPEQLRLLAKMIPKTQWLHTMNLDEVWATRKAWVFKPDTGYASRGVYVGDKLTKGKLAQLNPATTLMQQRIAPSVYKVDEQNQFKTDFRLFVYQGKILGITARLYQGQVTNLRTEGGGFARVCLV